MDNSFFFFKISFIVELVIKSFLIFLSEPSKLILVTGVGWSLADVLFSQFFLHSITLQFWIVKRVRWEYLILIVKKKKKKSCFHPNSFLIIEDSLGSTILSSCFHLFRNPTHSISTCTFFLLKKKFDMKFKIKNSIKLPPWSSDPYIGGGEKWAGFPTKFFLFHYTQNSNHNA